MAVTMLWTPERARKFADFAHEGQLDKAGVPYIRHVTGVADEAARLLVMENHDPEHPHRVSDFEREHMATVRMAAYLHDVVEDTPITFEHLDALGLPSEVLLIVSLLTRRKGQSSQEYYAVIKIHPLARIVKLADIAHNLNPHRLSKLPFETEQRLVKKYAKAKEMLGG